MHYACVIYTCGGTSSCICATRETGVVFFLPVIWHVCVLYGWSNTICSVGWKKMIPMYYWTLEACCMLNYTYYIYVFVVCDVRLSLVAVSELVEVAMVSNFRFFSSEKSKRRRHPSAAIWPLFPDICNAMANHGLAWHERSMLQDNKSSLRTQLDTYISSIHLFLVIVLRKHDRQNSLCNLDINNMPNALIHCWWLQLFFWPALYIVERNLESLGAWCVTSYFHFVNAREGLALQFHLFKKWRANFKHARKDIMHAARLTSKLTTY